MDFLVAGEVPTLSHCNASAGVGQRVAALLCSRVCVWDEERVFPQDRGGVMELCAEWHERHSKPHTAGGRVSAHTLERVYEPDLELI